MGRAVSLSAVKPPVSKGDFATPAGSKFKRKGNPRGPRPPSAAQWGKVFHTLDIATIDDPEVTITRSVCETYVRFANAYYQGELTSIHFIEAIDLLLHGRNSWGTSDQLVAYSWGEELPPFNRGRRIAGWKKRPAPGA